MRAFSPCALLAAVVCMAVPAFAQSPAAPADKSQAMKAGMEDLDAAARRIADAYVKHLGETYTSRIDTQRHLVFLSALDDKSFAETTDGLVRFAEAFADAIAPSERPWNVVIVLPVRTDMGDRKQRLVTGVYDPVSQTLVALDRGRTLCHEFTHALHHADMAQAHQRHAIWVAEGMATLLESSPVVDGKFDPKPDRRLVSLQSAIKKDKAPALGTLLKMTPEEFLKDPEVSYAAARYLMLYLHEKDKLKPWYEAYKASFAGDPTGRKALEKVLGQDLGAIERDWTAWANSLKVPADRGPQAKLGLEVQDTPGGVRVESFVRGSAAEKAGRIRTGDIITKVDGRAVATTAEFVSAVRGSSAMETITIELLRSQQPMSVAQTLGGP